MRPFQWHLKISDVTGHNNPLESEDDTTQGMVVRPSKCAIRRICPPQGTRKTNLYRPLKCSLGRSLRSKFYRRGLVSHRKASSHQPTRTEGGSSGSAILPIRLQKQSSPYRLRQHLSGVLHQQTGWYKISRTLCSNVENTHLVSPKQCHTHSKARTGSLNVIADGLSRRNQIQPTEWSLSPQIFKQISKLWESPQFTCSQPA